MDKRAKASRALVPNSFTPASEQIAPVEKLLFATVLTDTADAAQDDLVIFFFLVVDVCIIGRGGLLRLVDTSAA